MSTFNFNNSEQTLNKGIKNTITGDITTTVNATFEVILEFPANCKTTFLNKNKIMKFLIGNLSSNITNPVSLSFNINNNSSSREDCILTGKLIENNTIVDENTIIVQIN